MRGPSAVGRLLAGAFNVPREHRETLAGFLDRTARAGAAVAFDPGRCSTAKNAKRRKIHDLHFCDHPRLSRFKIGIRVARVPDTASTNHAITRRSEERRAGNEGTPR